ncbi:spore coat protein [Oscillospiraceae bacterium CM]|nr:spore coat protein [Oscillospiraceae bacterium CM]
MANLTSKELSALEDQVGQEQTLVKKYQAMATMCKDTQIQQCLNDYAGRHQQHVNSLVSFLQ